MYSPGSDVPSLSGREKGSEREMVLESISPERRLDSRSLGLVGAVIVRRWLGGVAGRRRAGSLEDSSGGGLDRGLTASCECLRLARRERRRKREPKQPVDVESLLSELMSLVKNVGAFSAPTQDVDVCKKQE